MKKLLVFLCAMVLFFGFVGVSQAIPTLDQELVPSAANAHWAVFDESSVQLPLYFGDQAQTFTVGLTGILDSVEVLIRSGIEDLSDPLVVDIRETISGVPRESNSEILGSVEIPAVDVPFTADFHDYNFVSVDLSSFGIPVNEGDVLAIVLRSAAPWAFWWGGRFNTDDSDPYAMGEHFWRGFSFTGNSSTWAEETTHLVDLGFKTYVDVAPVPEPATMLLLGSGLAGLFGFRRKLRKRQ